MCTICNIPVLLTQWVDLGCSRLAGLYTVDYGTYDLIKIVTNLLWHST